MSQESSDLSVVFKQLNVGGDTAAPVDDESDGSISPLQITALPEPHPAAACPPLQLSNGVESPMPPPPTASMLPVSFPASLPPVPVQILPLQFPQPVLSKDVPVGLSHADAAATLMKQIELLNQQLVHHQVEARKERQKARELKEAEDEKRGRDKSDNRLSKRELEDLKKSQGPTKLWSDGPVWQGVKLLEDAPLLQPLEGSRLSEAINAVLQEDSSDSENEYDDIEDLESSDDDGGDDDDDDEDDDADESDKEDAESSGGKTAWADDFPYEENLFRLSNHYQFVRRLATNDDAVVYEAKQKMEPFLPVAIKISQTDDEETMPKAVSLLSAVTGHPNLNRLICWHRLVNTECYCIVTELVPNDSIFDYVVGRPESIKKYIRDTLAAVEHCQSRGVLFRDVKPDNIMWSHDRQCAVIIDFDVATFTRTEGHRAVVGSDGYMAPEIVAISKAKSLWKKKKALERKEEKKRKAALLAAKKKEARKGKFRANATSGTPKKAPGAAASGTSTTEEPEPEKEKEGVRKRPSLEEFGLKAYGVNVDIFSCGVVLGQLLFNISDEFVLDYPDHNSDSMHDHFVRLIAKAEPEVAHDLVLRMTDKDPATRITIPEIYRHPYFTEDEKESQAILENLKLQAETVKSGGLKCFGCNSTLPREQFSKNQLKKKGTSVNTRRCLDCMKEP